MNNFGLDSPGLVPGPSYFSEYRWTKLIRHVWLILVTSSPPTSLQSERVIVYIDGFNLYHGLKDAKLGSSRWLDLDGMCRAFLLPHQKLQTVRYFTATVKGAPDSAKRQATYLNALEARGGVKIEFGFYQTSNVMMACRQCGDEQKRCPQCSTQYKRYEEKQSDVRMALRLVTDACKDRYDTAIVMTGDSDLVPAIETVKGLFPGKNVVADFPPKSMGESYSWQGRRCLQGGSETCSCQQASKSCD